MKNKVEILTKQLQERLDKESKIKNYTLYVVNGKTLIGGSLNENMGGIYRPITSNTAVGGHYVFEYTNGKYSSGVLDAGAWSDYENFLKAAEFASYEDKNAVPVLEKLESLNIQLADESIKDIVLNHPEKVSDFLKEMWNYHKDFKLRNIEGKIVFSYAMAAFATSKGVFLTSDGTSQEVEFYYDDIVGYGDDKRKNYDLKDIVDELNLYIEYTKELSKDKIKIDEGEYKILINPHHGFGFLNKFVLSNIYGAGVDAGVTKFSKEDFLNKKQIFKSGFTLGIDQTKDLKTESFNFNSEGILPQSFNIIEDGKLIEPVCDRRSAQKLGFKPKSFGSFEDIDYSHADSYEDFVSKNEKFIIIMSYLGIHTQNEVLGQYSLPCPNVLLVENGKIKGALSINISGDAFEKFLSADFQFVKHEFMQKPFLSFNTLVSNA